MEIMLRYLLVSLLLVTDLPAAAVETIGCRVIGISDGDTFSCLTPARETIRVRMAEIDTPEKDQPYGTRARQALSGYIFGKDVALQVQDRDRYGRTVARVEVGSTDVTAEMVRSGAAWVYRDYLKDRSLLNLEATAKHFKRGIWSLPPAQQQAPWEWRKQRRNNGAVQQAATRQPSDAGSFNCNRFKSCREMSGCAEARYQLQHCANPRIDGDRDGVPCEALCR